MSSYKNIAAAAAADLCMTPQRSPIVSTEPSTPPSRGRYSLRSSPHADVVVEPKTVMPTTTAVVGSAERSEDGGGSDDQLRNKVSRSDSSEEEREIARISELEATRRGIAPAPEEVRPRPRAHPTQYLFFILFFWFPKRRLSVSSFPPPPKKTQNICFVTGPTP